MMSFPQSKLAMARVVWEVARKAQIPIDAVVKSGTRLSCSISYFQRLIKCLIHAIVSLECDRLLRETCRNELHDLL